MDMTQFFQTIIPSDGFKFLVQVADNGTKHHTAYPDFESMVDAAAKMVQEGKPLYHACASYKELFYNEWGYVIGRRQDNVKLVKALWQDFDVGKLDKDGNLKSISYATKKDALDAIKTMMDEVGLPRPLLVSSGNGFHAYWPFTEAVTSTEWNELAVKVRSVFQSIGIKFDPSRDLDSASILRPVGSFNHGKEVVVLREQEPKPYAFYNELFSRYIVKKDLAVQTPKQAAHKFENELGSGATEFPPASLALAANHCGQIQHFRDSGGDGGYTTWLYVLSIAKHCVDGEELAHEWGDKYAGYSFKETQEKLDSFKQGPTTCAKFKQDCGDRCKGCKQTVTSPVQLGYSTETEAPTIAVVSDEGPPTKQAIPNWPNGFRLSPSNVIQMMLGDPPEPVRVAAPLFYLTERIRLDDGTYAFTVRMEVKKGKWREFQIPAKVTADARSLKPVLASYEIIVYNDKLLVSYVQSYSDTLRRTAEEVNTFKQFGWTESHDGFLIGTSLITADGRKEVKVSGEYVRDGDLLTAGTVRGSKDEWSNGVELLYNRPNGEAYRYAIATAFGAPLMPLLEFDAWHGIPLAITSDDSGHGKSTVCKIAINALCDSRKTTIASTTYNGIMGRASAMNNLPFLVDEVSAYIQDPELISQMSYSLSNGRAKIGMQADGRERPPLPPFKLGSYVSGNKNLYGELNKCKNNPEATKMRLFEINMDQYPRMDSLTKTSTIHAEHAAVTNRLIDHCHGVWADDYFAFVFANMDDIKARLYKAVYAITHALGGDAAKERFYAYHLACTLVGAWVAKKIGAIQFDVTELKHWGFNHILHLRGLVGQHSENVEEKLAQMLADMHGSILVTKHFDLLDTKAGNTEMPMVQMRGGFSARLVLGSEKERGKLFVSCRALDEWCSKNSIAPTVFRRQLAAADMLRSTGDQGRGFDKKISLGRGVPSMPSGRSRCMELDYNIAQGYVEEHITGSNVVPIAAAQLAVVSPAASQPASDSQSGS